MTPKELSDRADVIRMAVEAGLLAPYDTLADILGTGVERFFSGEDGVQSFERFAALVSAKEREACAQVCETQCDPNIDSNTSYADQVADGALNEVIDKIRARGN